MSEVRYQSSVHGWPEAVQKATSVQHHALSGNYANAHNSISATNRRKDGAWGVFLLQSHLLIRKHRFAAESDAASVKPVRRVDTSSFLALRLKRQRLRLSRSDLERVVHKFEKGTTRRG